MRRTVAEHRQAVEELLSQCWSAQSTPLMLDGGHRVALQSGLGRVLAQDVVAPLDLPPFANSQMDGYAVLVEEQGSAGSPRSYTVAPMIPAGAVPEPLRAGFAAPIMTGAMLPQGANAVVPIEQADPNTFGASDTVTLPATAPGTFVREQGSDVPRGACVIAAGTVLNAAHMGLASALGLSELSVRRRPRVLLLTTGDEVLHPEDGRAANGLPPGKIFDANQALLRAGLSQAGMEVAASLQVPDEPAELLRALEAEVAKKTEHGAGLDLIISVGGISAGAFEVVKQALGASGQLDFVSVAMQPGGPQGLGSFRGVPYLAFPGNPVSAFVSFEMFLRPALSSTLGGPLPRHRVVATLEENLSSPAGKHQVRRGIYSGPEFEVHPSVRLMGGESSHLLGALAQANALIHIPAGATELHAGAKVEVWLL